MRRVFGKILWLAPLLLAAVLSTGCGDDEEQAELQRVGATGGSTSHLDTRTGTPLPVVYPEGPKAPKPTGPLPADASCVTAQCHADMTRGTHIHGPVATRACDSCHGADTGKHEFPLKRDEVATCTHCHQVAGTQVHQHAALEQGCMNCHRPHTSQGKFLLTEATVGQQCAKCHTVPLHRFAHEAVAAGQCTNCHWPHQSQNVHLLRGGEGRDHCLSCHDTIKESLAKATYVHAPASKECAACHQAHTAPNPHLLSAPLQQGCLSCHEEIRQRITQSPVKHGAMLTDEGCSSCHTAHASEQPELLRARMDKVCLSCHDQAVKALDGREIASMDQVLKSKFLHGPVANGSCSGCHEPHGSIHPGLLEQAYPRVFYTSFAAEKYQLCFSCHDVQMVLADETQNLTNFRDGERNLHFVHVNRDEKGRTCRTCHSVHGSDLPNHMASEVPFEGSRWAMPIEYEKLTDGGSCTPGCHAPKTYKRVAAVLQDRGEQ